LERKHARHQVQAAQEAGAERIWMQAQSYASEFYQKSGFRVISEEYDLFNLGIPHVTMEFCGADQSGWPHA
jgi:predicted GNAT family N-acyltransferase